MATRRIGEVELEGVLGSGGMGRVWAGHAAGRPLAVKVLLEELRDNDESLARFDRERSILMKLQHPNIVRALDHGVSAGGAPFFVMERARGESLLQLLDREGALTVRETMALMEQVLAALEAVHAHGVVHRDIKPANIMVERREDRSLHVTLIDFGVASASWDSAITDFRHTVGTVCYMSPEQTFGGGGPEFQADLWGAAIVAYECLTGHVPFDGESIGSLCLAIYDGAFTPPTLASPALGLEADRFFKRAFARTWRDRFSSAAAMRHAIARALLPALRDDRLPCGTVRPRARGHQAPTATRTRRRTAPVRRYDSPPAGDAAPRFSLAVAALLLLGVVYSLALEPIQSTAEAQHGGRVVRVLP